MSIPAEFASSIAPITLQQEGATLIATISRPEAMNALNANVLAALEKLLTWLEGDRSVRVLILTGAGPKAFVAGADIREFSDLGAPEGAALARRGQALFGRLEQLGIPVIAAVNGFALGGGLELALACDFIVASENAKFGLPECTLGLMPGYGGTVRLPRRVGVARAREMTFTGSMISATEAVSAGLASRVVPLDQLIPNCLELAQTIASRAPIAIRQIKKSIGEGMNTTEENACELEARLFGELFATADKLEGVAAFLEKRKAVFQGQ